MCASEVSDSEHSIWQRYKDEGVIVLGIASQEPQTEIEQYVEQLGITFPVLKDSNGSVHAQYQQQSAFPTAAYPQDWVIGPDSTIVYRNNGYELDAILSAIGKAE